ncbi:MAG TPA: hypothetical protein VFT22_21925 [Kofleriaceae bacterium]|nr:hypothetical protein [Kofleriaceae bacterium]
MTSRELIRWSRLHERRARKLPVLVVPVVAGGLLAGWVGWRMTTGASAASHAWLVVAIVTYAVAFLRVPFHIYWRADAALLAQLPIEGRPLFDAALVRCVGAAASTTIAVVIGAAPLALGPGGLALYAHHVAFAAALGLADALLLPAVTVGAASLVVQGRGEQALRAATALGGAPGRAPAAATAPPASPGAILGALPGFAATAVLVAGLAVTPWLTGGATAVQAPVLLAVIAGVSVVAGLAARAGAAIMATVLRDVSALDRQRLAALEVKPPTRIEAAIARLLGEAALPYTKDAQLMRRRYPMAFAFGALGWIVLVIVGLARPDDPTPWLAAAIGGATAYGLALAGRLHRPPVELPRLSATLPLSPSAHARAKLAWLLGWWSIYILAPAVFAALRQTAPAFGLVLTAAATIVIIVAGALRR